MTDAVSRFVHELLHALPVGAALIRGEEASERNRHWSDDAAVQRHLEVPETGVVLALQWGSGVHPPISALVEQLEASRRLLRSLAEELPVGLALLDVEGRSVLFSNSTLADVTGRPAGRFLEWLGSEGVEIPPEAPGAQELVVEAARQGEVQLDMRARHGSRRGRRHLRIRLTAVQASIGVPMAVAALVEERTDRVRLEAAESARDRFMEVLFGTSRAGLILVDRDGRLRAMNADFQEILGYSHEELETLSFEALTAPEDMEGDLADFHRLCRGEIDRCERVKRCLRKDGRFIRSRVVSTRLPAAEGPSGLVLRVLHPLPE